MKRRLFSLHQSAFACSAIRSASSSVRALRRRIVSARSQPIHESSVAASTSPRGMVTRTAVGKASTSIIAYRAPLGAAAQLGTLHAICCALPGIVSYHSPIRLDVAPTDWPSLCAEHHLCYVAVLERHGKNGNVARGVLQDFGLRGGAVASTVGHDSHNLLVAGDDEPSMRLAVETLRDCQGGVCVVRAGKLAALVRLPVAGLLSDERAPAVAAVMAALKVEWTALGCTLPFMGFNLIPLSVIPELRLTDRGLVLVNEMRALPLWKN